MIVTVTMNPAIDKTVEIPELVQGGLNRISKVEYDAGGKGINVSKTIAALGGKSVATGFLGGNNGKIIENVLKDMDIACDFVWVEGETRTNTKVFEENGRVTELNEPGPVITGEQMEALFDRLLEYAGENTLFILAGSIPKGVEKDVYGKITQLVHGRNSKVLIDADGELFRASLDAVPDIIKPNCIELAEYAETAGIGPRHEDSQRDAALSRDELFAVAETLAEKGIGTIAVSMGAEGALFLHGDERVSCPAVPVKAHSTVGAGDAMVAALGLAWEKHLDLKETVRLSMAASAGAVTTVGTKPPSGELVDALMGQVTI